MVGALVFSLSGSVLLMGGQAHALKSLRSHPDPAWFTLDYQTYVILTLLGLVAFGLGMKAGLIEQDWKAELSKAASS